jgi:small conductance mechanosensitive channel
LLDRALKISLLVVLLSGAASAEAPAATEPIPMSPHMKEFLSAEAALSAEAQAADSNVEHIETLRSKLREDLGSVAAAEQKSKTATGTDAIALRDRANTMRVQGLSTLTDIVEAVQELDADSAAAAAYRAKLEKFLPELASALIAHIETAENDMEALLEEAKAASPEERFDMEQRASRSSDLIGQLLETGVELLVMTEDLGVEVPTSHEQLGVHLTDRARIIAGRVELMSARVTDAESRLAVTPDDATVQAALQAARDQLATDATRLSANLDLMDALSLETTEKRKLLFETTGEITTDVLDAEVVQSLLGEWLEDMSDVLVEQGPSFVFKILVFSLIIFAFWMSARFVRRVTERAVEAPHLRFSLLLKRMIISLSSGAVMVLGLLVALSQLGVQVGPLLAGLGIAGFIVGFALQETLANFAAGVMILAYQPYDVGDVIDCSGGVFGKVSHMNLVSTTILTFDNQTKVVPNGKIWGDVITNVTAQQTRRVDLVFGISYTDDIPHAEEVMWSVIKEHSKVIADPEPVVKLHELGDSSVNFVVRPWCAREDYWDVYWDVTREVKMRFDREGISIPFPQRDLHLYATQTNGGAPTSLGD